MPFTDTARLLYYLMNSAPAGRSTACTASLSGEITHKSLDNHFIVAQGFPEIVSYICRFQQPT